MAKTPNRNRVRLLPTLLACTVATTTLLYGPSVQHAEAADITGHLERANQQLAMFNWEPARRLYVDAIDLADHNSPQWQAAVFGAAVTSQHVSPASAERLGQASAWYTTLSAPALNSRFAARALMNLGRLAELKDFDADQVDLDSAKKHYSAVIERFPTDPIASEAMLRLAGAHVQTFDKKQIAQGAELLKKWIAEHPSDPLESAMYQYIGDAHFFLEDYRPSLDAYMKADEIGWTDAGNQGPIYWRMAIMADRYLKDIDAAAKYYTKIIVETPYSGKAYEAQIALKGMGRPAPEIKLFRAAAPPAPASAPTTAPATQPVAINDNAQQPAIGGINGR